MDVSEYQFGDDEIAKLNDHRDNQPDVRLKVRFIALLMLAERVELKSIASIIGKSPKTIENWHNQYVTKGIDSLNSFQYKPKQSYLTSEQIDLVVKWAKETNPGKTKEVREYIKTHFKVAYSNEAVRKILKKRGLKILRPKVVPGNPPSEEEQKKKIENYFEMKRTAVPGTVFLFGDGMHLIHQNVPGLCWGDPKDPPILKTNTGRQRLNILGAYNPDLHSFVHLTGEENCNAERVIEYFDVILKVYRRVPSIVLFLDNATYFKAKIVRTWLKDHPKLKLEFLPPYSPNLNLIERFWRFVKEHLVKNTYYKKYKTFRAKVFQLLN
ncbi:IS630 family transposase, partial [Desulfosarcina sp.]|nr:IS630 family transposase [Desulfosarcina sp.]